MLKRTRGDRLPRKAMRIPHGSRGVVRTTCILRWRICVSAEHAILISDGNAGVDYRGLSPSQTHCLNSFEMHFACRSIYSDQNVALIDKGFKSTREGVLLDIARGGSSIYKLQEHPKQYRRDIDGTETGRATGKVAGGEIAFLYHFYTF